MSGLLDFRKLEAGELLEIFNTVAARGVGRFFFIY
jgi:hypothetical protein